MVAVILGVWSNHFVNGFHSDDEYTIVRNPAIQDLSHVPQFFTNPLLFSARPEGADYRPVLSTLFAVDYALADGARPFIFQAENFAWLLLAVFWVYLLFLLIPGVSPSGAALGAALCAIHPALADIVNYPLNRSYLIGSAGLCSGLILWIFFPRMLPAKLPMKYYQFPRNRTEEIKRWAHPLLSEAWDALLRLPLPFYLIPVCFTMLAEPTVAVFPLLLLTWIVLFERGQSLRRVIPSAAVCGLFWIGRTAWVWALTSSAKLPLASYLWTQPWAAVRSVLRFLSPVGLSATMDMQPLPSPFSPLALAGFAGCALLVFVAAVTAKREGWQTVSFGLWWFLITFLPEALTPQHVAASDGRMLIPMTGLALAAAALCVAMYHRFSARLTVPVYAEALGWAAACLLVGALAHETWNRNRVWASDDTLWQDVADKNPGDGNALLNYGKRSIARGDSVGGFELVKRGGALLPNDAHAEMILAVASSDMDRDAEAEAHFRKAIALNPGVARNFSTFAQWLADRQRHPEALAMAHKALEIRDIDLTARHLILDDFSRRYKWEEQIAYAEQTLKKAPQDENARDMLHVAEVALTKIHDAEAKAKAHPSVDAYLALSVTYFQNLRYEESVRAAKAAIELNPSLPHGYANMGVAYYALGKLDDSIQALETAVKLNPNLPGVKNTLDYEVSEKSSTARR